MIVGITYIEAFVEEPQDVYAFLQHAVKWDERMMARKTASYGKATRFQKPIPIGAE